jgi:hypothetical protein
MRGTAPICALVVVVVAAAPASAGKPKKELEKTVKAQVTALFEYEDTAGPYADGAQFTTGLGDEGVVDVAGLRKAMERHVRAFGMVKATKVANLKVALDDAKEPIGGWASFTVKVTMIEDEQGDAPASFELRVTEAFELQDSGWKVLAGHWSRPVTDKSAHTDAKKGKLGTLAALPETPIEDQTTIAYSAMMSAGTGAFDLIESVSNRADVAVFSTDAKKPRMGGKVNKKAWKVWWKTVSADDTYGGQNPGKQIGWVFANLTVQKKGYTIPVRAFLVLSEEEGSLNVVAGHLSVPYQPEWE